MQALTQNPEVALTRASKAVDSILSLTALPTANDALQHLGALIPNFSLVDAADNLRSVIGGAINLTIRQGFSPFASVEERTVAHRLAWRLEALLDDIKEGQLFSSALSYGMAESLMGDNFLGVQHYQAPLGVRVPSAPPFPAGLTRELLESRCILSREDRAVAETHLLAYIPPEISGHPFTVRNLGRLVDRISNESDTAPAARWSPWYDYEPFANSAAHVGRWVLLPKFIVPGTLNRSFDEQKRNLSAFPEYEVADARELIAAHALYFMNQGEHLFREFGRCRDQTFDRQQVQVGFASRWGFVIERGQPEERRPCIGLAASRRLYLS